MPAVVKKSKKDTAKKATPEKPVKKFVSESVSNESNDARKQKAAP